MCGVGDRLVLVCWTCHDLWYKVLNGVTSKSLLRKSSYTCSMAVNEHAGPSKALNSYGD